MIRRFLSLTIVLLLFFGVLTEQCYAAEIRGYPITEQSEEEIESFLERHEWKNLPLDTEKTASIDSFAAADQGLCAIAIDNRIFVYKETAVAACYHYETAGTFNLLFEGRTLVVHEVRGNCLLFIHCDTGEMSLYTLEPEKADLRLQSKFYKFADNPRNATVEGKGYYVTNQWPWMDSLTNSHEKLIFVENGQETILHESYTHLIWLGLFATASVIAGLLFLFKFREYRQNKREQITQ